MKTPRLSLGLTIVELMVAIAIALILSLGLVVLLANTSRSFSVQDETARLYDAGALALRSLANDIRMAGFYGSGSRADSVDISHVMGVTITGDCGPPQPTGPWALVITTPIEVRTGLTPATAPIEFPCIAPENFLPGSPIIVLRGALGNRILDRNGNGNLADDIVNEPNFANTVYAQSMAGQDPNTILFLGQDYAALKSNNRTRTYTNGDDAPIFALQTHVYYIRPCSRPTPPASTCDATSDGGQPIPTLVRHELVGTSMRPVPLAEGIEALVLELGIDADNDGVAERFELAPASGGQIDWSRVVAVRTTLLARSTQPIPGHDDSSKTYDLAGMAWNCADAGAPCNFTRHVFSQLVNLRNCSARRGLTGSC